MKMKSTQLFVPMMMVIMITIVPKTTTITTSWTTTTPRPTTTTPRPTTTTPKPTTTTPRPTTTTPKPTTTTPRPTTTTPKPTTTTPRPTTTTPKPTTTTPRPTTTTRKWTTTTRRWTTTTQWTTGHPAVNLNGKMVTLSYNGGGISFYPPNYSPQPSAWPSTPSYTTTYPFSTTPPSTRGLSMCLRYLSDYMPTSYPPTFIVSPRSSHPLTLRFRTTSYEVSFDRYGYTNLYLSPRIKLLPGVAPDIWTRVCLTIDSMKNVAQMFSGSYMSIRKMLNDRYSWTSEPVIAVSGFDGQVTDVQMWDYPLSYREVTDYMNGGVYRLYRGSILSWSYINYSLSGNVLLEDVYEIQAKQPVSRRGRGRRPKGENKTRRVFNVGESKSRERQQL